MRRLLQQPAERDDGRQERKVHEADGCDALQVHGVPVVAQQPGQLPLHVRDQPAAEAPGALQGGVVSVPVLLVLHRLLGRLPALLVHRLLHEFLGHLHALLLGRDLGGGLDPDGRVPFAGRQHRDLVQELVHAVQQVIAVPGLVGHVVENLQNILFIFNNHVPKTTTDWFAIFPTF